MSRKYQELTSHLLDGEFEGYKYLIYFCYLSTILPLTIPSQLCSSCMLMQSISMWPELFTDRGGGNSNGYGCISKFMEASVLLGSLDVLWCSESSEKRPVLNHNTFYQTNLTGLQHVISCI